MSCIGRNGTTLAEVFIQVPTNGTHFYNYLTRGYLIMKSMSMAVMAVAVAVTFSAPAFAGEEKKDEKMGGHVVVYGDDKKKDEKRGRPCRHLR